METYYILQSLIYAFNEDIVRDEIMNRACRVASNADVRWKGTVRLNRQSQFTQHRKWRLCTAKRDDRMIVFTASYTYRKNRVHYVAFVLRPSKRELLCFDPGYDLYLYGRHKIIPMVANALHEDGWIDAPILLQGPCTRKRQHGFGIQYNGDNPRKVRLPADAFCQTWTLFFLTTFIQHDGDVSFFEEWCRIQPRQREFFLLQNFTLPTLSTTLSKRAKSILNISEKDKRIVETYIMNTFWTRV